MRIVWKHMPLSIHKDAPGAHLASIAAHSQGKFWEFHDEIFANPKQLNMDKYKEYAQKLNLDLDRFESDLTDLENKKLMDADMAEARSLGVTGTPGFFVNGRFLSGAKPFEAFATVINEELRKNGRPVPAAAQS